MRSQADALVSDLLSKVDRHEDWRVGQTINLIPSENQVSPAVKKLLSSDFGNRYTAPDRFYQGTRYLDEVEALGKEVAKRVFGARFADLRPLSGHVAVLIVILSLLRQGGKFFMVSPEDGGYPGCSHTGFPRLTNRHPVYFPYDRDRMTIDESKTPRLIEYERPGLCVFGASFIPFPHPTKQVSESSEVPCVYDGSHVLGLIAGGSFQQPLAEGCGVLYGSTHKSFWGPQGGMIVAGDEEMFSRIEANIHPSLVDNAHWNRIAALSYALIESLEFGKRYAKQVVRNSQALARSLDEAGIQVRGSRHGFTKSHQVIIDNSESGSKLWPKLLEQVNIIVDNGIRLGTSEVTRLGMREREMEEIASIFSDVVRRRISKDEAKRRVHGLKSRFQSLQFTFES